MNVFKLEFKSSFKGFVMWSSIVSVIMIFFMSFYPSMQTKMMQTLVDAKLDAIPPVALKVLGISQISDLSNITYYFAYIMQYINITAAIYAALLGSSALIKEESQGTIEYLYAQPVKRSTIVIQKMLSTFCIYALFTTALILVTTILFALFKNKDADLIPLIANIKLIYGGMFFAGLIFMSLGFATSAILKNLQQTAPFSMGIVFVTFIFGIIAILIDKLEFLKYFSPIDFVKPNVLVASGFDTTFVIIGICIIAVSVATSILLYKRKDLLV